jgi:uncharacterized protein
MKRISWIGIFLLLLLFLSGLGESETVAAQTPHLKQSEKQSQQYLRGLVESYELEKYRRAGDYRMVYGIVEPLARRGDARAQYEIGMLHYQGRLSGNYEYEEALKWLRLSADQGYREASSVLGEMYDRGRGVNADDTLAMKYLKLAAEKGDVHSQNTLAKRYFDGRGVIRDESLARYWIQRAANQNYARSQMGLAVLLRKSGGESNMVEALKWVYLARKWWPGKDENDISTARLMTLDFESTMSRAAIDRAMRLADGWKPKWE